MYMPKSILHALAVSDTLIKWQNRHECRTSGSTWTSSNAFFFILSDVDMIGTGHDRYENTCKGDDDGKNSVRFSVHKFRNPEEKLRISLH